MTLNNMKLKILISNWHTGFRVVNEIFRSSALSSALMSNVCWTRPGVPSWAQVAASPSHLMSWPSAAQLILQPPPLQLTSCSPGLWWQLAPFLQTSARFFINFLSGLLICWGNLTIETIQQNSPLLRQHWLQFQSNIFSASDLQRQTKWQILQVTSWSPGYCWLFWA